jgi:acyl-[acyl-carrier-protein] desaturase
MGLTDADRQLGDRIAVLRDLEGVVADLMARHEEKRELWFPEDLLGPGPGQDPDRHEDDLRARAAGIPDHARAALALNLLTEEGLPHFHRVLAVHLGHDSVWRDWTNLWTAEEDRHGVILSAYARTTRIFDQRRLEQLQFEYLRRGFDPQWDRDPYRVFVYTTLQERATQQSHSQTGKVVAEYEPLLGEALARVATEEARHFNFYRSIFEAVLERDPDGALHSASLVMPAIDMPAISLPGFKEFADVIRRSGIYGPRDYLRIVQEQIRAWRIETLTGLGEIGRRAQERILEVPDRLRRIADLMEARARARTFQFEVVFNREFAME